MTGAVGNDIVWLGEPRNRGRAADRRLVERILTPAERVLVEASEDPDRTLWSLWAAKEAGFKAFAQDHPEAVFSPVRFTVVHGELGTGTVSFEGWSLPVLFQSGEDWVHAVAAGDPGAVTVAIERRSPGSGTPDDSADVRDLAARILTAAGRGQGTVEGRPPRYRIGGADAGVRLSLSHDGPWLAVAFRQDI